MSFSIPASTHQAISQNLVNLSPLTLCRNTKSIPTWADQNPPILNAVRLLCYVPLLSDPQAPAEDWEKPSITVTTYLKKKKSKPSRLTLSLNFHIIVSHFLSQLETALWSQKDGGNTSMAQLPNSTQEKPNNQVPCILQKSVSQITDPPSSTYKTSSSFWFYQPIGPWLTWK